MKILPITCSLTTFCIYFLAELKEQQLQDLKDSLTVQTSHESSIETGVNHMKLYVANVVDEVNYQCSSIDIPRWLCL